MTMTTRVHCENQPAWQRFQSELMIPSTRSAASQSKGSAAPAAPSNVYQRQYAHVYHHRLTQLAPVISERMGTPVIRILELKEDVEGTVVGTVVVNDMEAFLEDTSSRVAVKFPNNHTYCSGIVLGLTGVVGSDGVLHVKHVHTPFKVEKNIAPPEPVITDSTSPHVLLLSGLECGSPEYSSLSRDMLITFLQGLLGGKASNISQVILAGGLVCSTETTHGCRELDAFCWQLTRAGIPVTVVPGRDDPVTANWPQRPLHRSLLPRSVGPLLQRSPNPYAGTFSVSENRQQHVLGTDGLNVTDLAAKTNCSELEALQDTIRYAHVCPTGPDSVPTIPHASKDPMVMAKTIPNLYFAGGASEFSSSKVTVNDSTTCRLVCVPKFAVTGLCSLVNLETLDVELLRFDAS